MLPGKDKIEGEEGFASSPPLEGLGACGMKQGGAHINNKETITTMNKYTNNKKMRNRGGAFQRIIRRYETMRVREPARCPARMRSKDRKALHPALRAAGANSSGAWRLGSLR